MSILQKAMSLLGIYYQPLLPHGGAGSSGGPSTSGVAVTGVSAMGVSAFFACARLLSSTVATLPLFLYETKGGNQRVLAKGHPLYSVLHDSPNADQTSLDFLEFIMLSLIFDGNFYAKKIIGAGGRLIGLEPIQPEGVTVYRLPSGERGYRYNNRGGQVESTEADIFHILGYGGGPLKGLSTLSYARNTIGIAIAADNAASALFRNGMRVSGALETDTKLTAEDRVAMEEALAAKFSGAMNAGRPMLLDRGMKWNALSLNAGDAELLSSRAYSVEEICRFMGVPPFMIGHSEKSSAYPTSIEQQLLGFQKFSLMPYLKRIEMAISKQLIPAQERGRFHAEFSMEGIMRADSLARATYYRTMIMMGVMTINEVRRLENLPPVEGGDVVLTQSQNIPLIAAIEDALGGSKL